MNLSIEAAVLPASWASALVNRDYSGLDRTERAEIVQWSAQNHTFAACIVSCEDAYVDRYNGALCQVAEFSALIRNDAVS